MTLLTPSQLSMRCGKRILEFRGKRASSVGVTLRSSSFSLPAFYRVKRIEPSARTWHTMIEVQSRVGNMDAMTALYEEALRSNAKSLYSLIEVHNAYLAGLYRCTSDTRLMEKAFKDISEKYGLEPNRSSYSIMIKAYVRSREYEQAKEVGWIAKHVWSRFDRKPFVLKLNFNLSTGAIALH